MATTLNVKLKNGPIDENKIEQLRKIQITKGTTGLLKSTAINAKERTRRPALGELGNRATQITTLKDKDEKKEIINKVLGQINIRNVKPRVDTHLKRPPTVLGATRNLIRTESLKNINNENAKIGLNGLTRAASVKNLGDIAASKKVVTRATSKATLVTKPCAVAIKKDDVPIKREDSNLSRRSLTKLRAALSKDKKLSVESNGSGQTDLIKSKPAITSNKGSSNKIATHETKVVKKIPTADVKEKETIVEIKSLNKFDENVEDIDSNDNDNTYMLPEYVNDIYSYLYDLEKQFPIEIDHLKGQADVSPKMRAILMDWINEVGFQFHLLPETYHMTVSIIDRYLQANKNTARKHLQLVGSTSLFIASKYEELYPADINDFVFISDYSYSKGQILAMEKKIMTTLDFQLCRPVPIIFLRRYSKAAKAEKEHHACSKYILELATIEYTTSHYRPSEIAAAALYLSLQLFNVKKCPAIELWTPTLQFYSCYKTEHLDPIVKKLARLVFDAPSSKQKAIYNKYSYSKFDKLSLRSELYGSVMKNILG